MARRPRATRTPAEYRFAFDGFREGWYVLRADMTARGEHLEALAFQTRVTNWLVTQRITPGTWSHFGSGNTGEYPVVPENEDGHALHLLLKRPADVLRLADNFPCVGVTVESLHAAIRAEASVHRFIIEDAARIAHDAIRRLMLAFGDNYPTWETLGGETRVAFMLQVQQQIDHPDRTVEDVHQRWVDQRRKDGWNYASILNVERQTDPLLVPWKNLNARQQTRYRLIASITASVAPLLID